MVATLQAWCRSGCPLPVDRNPRLQVERSKPNRQHALLHGLGVIAWTDTTLPAPDVVIGSTVHPFAAWAALRLARRKGVPFIFEIRDVWPETLIDFGHWQANGWKARSVRKLMMHLVRESVMVLSPLPGIPLYLEQIGEAKKPFLWISNGAETHQSLPDADQPSVEPFVFMYLGSHGNANVLDHLIDGFNIFRRDHPTTVARLEFVGDGPLKEELSPTRKPQALRSLSSFLIAYRVPR